MGCTCGYAIGHPLVPVCTCKKKRKKEWVELTKEDVEGWELPIKPTIYEFAKFVEKQVKEKNT